MSVPPAVTPQLPLSLRHASDQRLESFVGAPDGALAQLRALARQPGADWLYVAGAGGTGKTHLALAVCAEAGLAGRHASYLPLAAVAGRLEEALEAARHSALAVLDGLEAIAGGRDD